ncbi:MAG TPA: CHAT domain-containing protein [Nonomuraea sp.]|nr:CHAT domain-containing protein [Nonomuraea sp.]
MSIHLASPAMQLVTLAAEQARGRPVDTRDILAASARYQPDAWLRALLQLELPNDVFHGPAEESSAVRHLSGVPVTVQLEEAARLAMKLAARYGFAGCPAGVLVLAVVLSSESLARKTVESGVLPLDKSVKVLAEAFLDGELENLTEVVLQCELEGLTAAAASSHNQGSAPDKRDYARRVREKLLLRERMTSAVAVAAAIALVVPSPTVKLALICLVSIGMRSRRLLLIVLILAFVGATIAGGLLAPMAFAGAALVAYVARRAISSPYGRRRAFHGGFVSLLSRPKLMLDLSRAQRLLRLDYPEDAAAILRRLLAKAPSRALLRLRLRAADAALRSGDFQEALALCRTIRQSAGDKMPARTRIRLAITEGSALLEAGNSREALPILQEAARSATRMRRTLLRADAEVALGEGLVQAGDPMAALSYFWDAAERYLRTFRLVDLARALRGCAQLHETAGSSAAGYLRNAARDIALDLALLWRREMYNADIPARARAGIREYALVNLDTARITVDTDQDEEFLSWVGPDGGIAAMFEQLGLTLQQAEALGLYARRLERDGMHDTALHHRLATVGALDERRYRLRSQRDRAGWAFRYNVAVADALACSVRVADPIATALVIEAARVQGLPRGATSRASASHQDSVARTLRGELPLRPPPLIRVRGDTRLLGPYAGERPKALDLERMACVAAGAGAWWWGQWSSADGTIIYWSLVPPEGEVASGRLLCAPGSELSILMERLMRALPVRLDGEDSADIARRVVTGELYDPEAEAKLMERLGRLLIPEPLRHALHRRSASREGPLPLAIGPAVGLARIPWAGLGVWTVDGDYARLVELADIALAPSATMLDLLDKRVRVASGPVGLAVLNPTGDLPGAGDLRRFLPSTAVVLDDGTAGVPATKANLQLALTSLDRASTLVIACHPVPASPGEPSTGALLLREGTLTAGELLSTDERFHIPRRVAVLGCESADISGAAYGEWLTLGPALLWAGADEVLVTVHPILDDREVEPELLPYLDSGAGLLSALSAWQRHCLAQWRKYGCTYSPALWAGHAFLGCSRVLGEHGHEMGAATAPPLSIEVRHLLAWCLRFARELGQPVVTTGHVAHQFLEDEFDILQTHAVKEGLFTLGGGAVLKFLRRERGAQEDKRDPGPSTDLLELVVNARLRAGAMGDSLTSPAHLILELLDGRYPDGKLMVRLMMPGSRPSFRHAVLRNARQASPGTAAWVHEDEDGRLFNEIVRLVPPATDESA